MVREHEKERKGERETEEDISISSHAWVSPSRGENLLSGINLEINKLVCVQGYDFTVAHQGSAK